MKAAAVFLLSFLFFSAGAQGRLGSILAAFIDPGALQDISGGTPASGAVLPAVPAGPLTQGTAAGPQVVKPDPHITTNSGCPQGYLLIGGMCYRAVQTAN